MIFKEPSFTVGVEEEYLLVDKETRALVIDPPETLMAEAEELCGPQVASELLRSQIEVGSKVCQTIGEAHEDLARLRAAIRAPKRKVRTHDKKEVEQELAKLIPGARLVGTRGFGRAVIRHMQT